MDKKKFWIRMIAFSLFSCILPFIYIAFRYNLFTKVSKIQIGGWGFIAILIVFFFCRYVIVMMRKGVPYSMTSQIIMGILKVIVPLGLVWVFVWNIRSDIDLFLNSLGVVILLEAVAIPVNPLPQWVDMHKKNETDTMMDLLVDKLHNKGVEN